MRLSPGRDPPLAAVNLKKTFVTFHINRFITTGIIVSVIIIMIIIIIS